MLSDMSALLPVVTRIYDSTGAVISLADAEVLQFDAPLTITKSTAIGPPTVKVGLEAVVITTSSPVVQNPVTATGGDMTILAFASAEVPTRITGAAMFAGGSLTAHDTNYAIVTLYDATDGTAKTAIPGAVATTKTSGAGGTGDWTGGTLAIDLGAGVDISAGHYVVAVWTHGGTGVTVPGGWWRIT